MKAKIHLIYSLDSPRSWQTSRTSCVDCLWKSLARMSASYEKGKMWQETYFRMMLYRFGHTLSITPSLMRVQQGHKCLKLSILTESVDHMRKLLISWRESPQSKADSKPCSSSKNLTNWLMNLHASSSCQGVQGTHAVEYRVTFYSAATCHAVAVPDSFRLGEGLAVGGGPVEACSLVIWIRVD